MSEPTHAHNHAPGRVFLPPRLAVDVRIAGNHVRQWERPGVAGEASVIPFSYRRVTGTLVERNGEEPVLIVPRVTSSRKVARVLLQPGDCSPKGSLGELPKGTRWLSPRPAATPDPVAAAASWRDRFALREEQSDGDGGGEPGLREPQVGAVYGVLSHWKGEGGVCTVVMPTGTGKTETMLALLAHQGPRRLLVIVPTDALRTQITRKFLGFGVLREFGLLDPAARLPVVGTLARGVKDPAEMLKFASTCNVVVATMPSLSTCSPDARAALVGAASHLFFDEAHHAAAETWADARRMAEDAGLSVVQFTATPYRRDGKPVGGRVAFRYPLAKALAAGYFKPIRFRPVCEFDPAAADRAVASRALGLLREDWAAGLDHLMMARARTVERAAEVFGVYRELAEDLSPVLVHSRMPADERRAALNALDTRASRVVVCVDMFGEGFDLPSLKVAAMHDIHKSLAVTVQFAGRFTRTGGGLGEAALVANLADADVEQALQDLYTQDADWNKVLQRLSGEEIGRQRERTEFVQGFGEQAGEVALEALRPALSSVVYRTACRCWSPEAAEQFVGDRALLIPPTVNPARRVLVFALRATPDVAWVRGRGIRDRLHQLFLVHWDEDAGLLHVNASDTDADTDALARLVCGDDTHRISGEVVYRAFEGLARLKLQVAGLTHLVKDATRFEQRFGSDIGQDTNPVNRTKTNLFGRGVRDGVEECLGASKKGRIWLRERTDDLARWVSWTAEVGTRLTDESIPTDWPLKNAVVPERVTARPAAVPVAAYWPPALWGYSEEKLVLNDGGTAVPFHEAGLAVARYEETGPLTFRVEVPGRVWTYEVRLSKSGADYRHAGKNEPTLRYGRTIEPLSKFFARNPPPLHFSDASVLEGTELSKLNSGICPFDADKIEVWDWAGTDIKVESRFKPENGGLTRRVDSIQERVLAELAASAPAYRLIVDDDDAGESADVVGLRVDGDTLVVDLFHLKYSGGAKPGGRVSDFYEVCGQAQKGADWCNRYTQLPKHLLLRDVQRARKYGEPRIERGTRSGLQSLGRSARLMDRRCTITLVQPGLSVKAVTPEILTLLGATEQYVRETTGATLRVIASA